MHDLKHKALSGIKEMLEERTAGRMKPKAMAVEVTAVGGKKPPEGEEMPDSEMAGMDLSKLTPEEQTQLQALYEKACS